MGGFRIIDPFQGVGQGIANLQSALVNRQQQERQAQIDEQNALISQERLRGLQIGNDQAIAQQQASEQADEVRQAILAGAQSDPENPMRGALQVMRQISPIEALSVEGKFRKQALEQIKSGQVDPVKVEAAFQETTGKSLNLLPSQRFVREKLKDTDRIVEFDLLGERAPKEIISPSVKPKEPSLAQLDRLRAFQIKANELGKAVDALSPLERDQAVAEQKKRLQISNPQLEMIDRQLQLLRLEQLRGAGNMNPVQFRRATRLSDQFDRQSREFIALADRYSDIRALATSKPSAAGDMSLIFAYMKMLDPRSTVREGEQAQAEQATGVPARILNLYNKTVTGQKLNDDQRRDFNDKARVLFSSKLKRHRRLETQFRNRAKSAGVDPDFVVFDYAGGLAFEGGSGREKTNLTSEKARGLTNDELAEGMP